MAYQGMQGQPGGAPGQVGADPLYGYFSAVAGADGQIDATELQRALTASGIAGTYTPFSLETCRLLIATMDRDYSGSMGFTEFKEMWGALNQWKSTFMSFDHDRSGTINPNELQTALKSFGYNLSPQALNVIVKRYPNMKLDDFVSVAIKLRMLTDHFRRRDTAQTGFANFGYDDFVQINMHV